MVKTTRKRKLDKGRITASVAKEEANIVDAIDVVRGRRRVIDETHILKQI